MIKDTTHQHQCASKTARSKTSSNFYRKGKKLTENQLAIEDTKKYYQKYYENPNPLFISQLKTETLNVYLSNFKFNDIIVINKILYKYYFFKNLTLAPSDPLRKEQKSRRYEREPLTEGEKVKLAKEKRDKEIENMHIINKITLGIGRHLILTPNLFSLTIVNFTIDRKFAQNISKGIIGNKSIHALCINNCKMTIETYEILVKGLLNHESIEYLDLKNNDLGDKYGNMVGRIIARQTYRRDQVIWLYGLRNELPLTKDYTLGLIYLNLNGNNLSSYSADCITTSLASDQYVRSIILTNNNFDAASCKKFIYMLRRNITLLNVNLRDNPGYDDNIETRLVMKISKNIRNLYIQFKNDKFTEEEFQSLKRFIDTSFFDLDIPEEIVELYNNNLQKITEGNNINENINNKIIKDKLNNKNNVINKVMSDIQEEDKEYSNSNASKNSFTVLTPNSKNKNKGAILKTNSKINESENKKLKEENLLLKQQILELKAQNLQNKLGKNLNMPNKYNLDSLRQNYKKADELFDKLNGIITTMSNDEEKAPSKEIKNNVVNKKEKEKEKEKEDDKKINLDKNNNYITPNDVDKEEDIKVNNNINISGKKKDKEKEKDIDEEKSDKKKNEKGSNKKGKDNNLYIYNEGEGEEDDDDIDLENLNEEEIKMLQHQQLYEHLKKEYAAKGMKFDIDDYMAWYEHEAEQEEEDDAEMEGGK